MWEIWWETWSPKRRRIGLLGGKWSPKRCCAGLLGGKWSPKTASFLQTCMSNWSFLNTTPSLLSLRNWNWNSLSDSLSSPSLHGFLLQTSPRTKSTPLKHSNFPNVTHSLALVDTTAQGTKKQSSKEKGDFTFPFSSVIFNFLWVDTMIGLSLWNILTLVEKLAKCGQS